MFCISFFLSVTITVRKSNFPEHLSGGVPDVFFIEIQLENGIDTLKSEGKDWLMARKGFGKNSMKKEKIAILAASGFVLAALTMTGLYMRGQEQAKQDDGYTIDFQALEESVENKSQQIAQNRLEDNAGKVSVDEEADKQKENTPSKDSSAKKPAKTEEVKPEGEMQPEAESVPGDAAQNVSEGGEQPQVAESQDSALEAGTTQIINSPALNYSEGDGLTRPLEGEVILPFSMDSSIYFTTLDQYKYNPAMVIAAEPGTSVVACADGQVSNIYDSRETGKTVVVDLGDGYAMTYGQLADVSVTVGSYITEGSLIAKVAQPSIYYSAEGANLYLKLEKDGVPVNPEVLFK